MSNPIKSRNPHRPNTVARWVLSTLLATAVALAHANDAGAYDLMLSLSPNRSLPVLVQGRTVSGPIYVFISPATGKA